MYATLLALFITVPTTHIKLDVDACPKTDYVILIDGQEIKGNTINLPNVSESGREFNIEIRYINGWEVVRQNFPVRFAPRSSYTLRIVVPRVYPMVIEL